MFTYKVYNKPKTIKPSKEILVLIFSLSSEYINKEQNGIINIVFESDDNIKELNRTYRDIDKTTDVLSFHYFEDYKDLPKNEVAGEIILSPTRIESQSKEYNISQTEETYKLIIHSVLHLLGYDHEEDKDHEKMQEIAQKIETEINKKFALNIK